MSPIPERYEVATAVEEIVASSPDQPRIDDSSLTALGVPPKENEGFGTAARAGGSWTVIEAWRLDAESRQPAADKAMKINMTGPDRPPSRMRRSLAGGA
ncbi:MAG: hypothetical protein ABI454_11335 [Sphingomicrobium sp.]